VTRAHIFGTAYSIVNARKEAKDLLKKYKEHLVKAKLERKYYNKNTKLAEQQRKLVDEHFITLIIVALTLLLITVTIERKMFTCPIPINR